MSYVHPEREEFLPDAVLRCTPLPTSDLVVVDERFDERPPAVRRRTMRPLPEGSLP
jgi:hypothetical protein